jgi:hypothetical protein
MASTRTLLVACLSLIAMPSWADMTSAMATYNRGDYAGALKEFGVLSEQGNAVAQNLLGNMYATGKGVPENISEALKWYRRAARQGNPESQYHIGSLYAQGLLMPALRVSERKDLPWLENLASIFSWSNYYQIESANIPETAKDLAKAKVPNEYTVQGSLAPGRARNRGTLQNYNAYFWLALSAAGGYKEAIPLRDAEVAKLTRDAIVKAQEEIKEWRPYVEKKEPRKPTILEKILAALTRKKEK